MMQNEKTSLKKLLKILHKLMYLEHLLTFSYNTYNWVVPKSLSAQLCGTHRKIMRKTKSTNQEYDTK